MSEKSVIVVFPEDVTQTTWYSVPERMPNCSMYFSMSFIVFVPPVLGDDKRILVSLSYLYGCTADFLLGKQVPSPATAIDTTGLTDEQIAALAKLVETMRRK